MPCNCSTRKSGGNASATATGAASPAVANNVSSRASSSSSSAAPSGAAAAAAAAAPEVEVVVLTRQERRRLLARTVYITGLPPEMSQGALAALCAAAGPYSRVRVCGNGDAGQHWVYGFVEFETPEAAAEMLQVSGTEVRPAANSGGADPGANARGEHTGGDAEDDDSARPPLRLKCVLAKHPIVDTIASDADAAAGRPCSFGAGDAADRPISDVLLVAAQRQRIQRTRERRQQQREARQAAEAPCECGCVPGSCCPCCRCWDNFMPPPPEESVVSTIDHILAPGRLGPRAHNGASSGDESDSEEGEEADAVAGEANELSKKISPGGRPTGVLPVLDFGSYADTADTTEPAVAAAPSVSGASAGGGCYCGPRNGPLSPPSSSAAAATALLEALKSITPDSPTALLHDCEKRLRSAWIAASDAAKSFQDASSEALLNDSPPAAASALAQLDSVLGALEVSGLLPESAANASSGGAPPLESLTHMRAVRLSLAATLTAALLCLATRDVSRAVAYISATVVRVAAIPAPGGSPPAVASSCSAADAAFHAYVLDVLVAVAAAMEEVQPAVARSTCALAASRGREVLGRCPAAVAACAAGGGRLGGALRLPALERDVTAFPRHFFAGAAAAAAAAEGDAFWDALPPLHCVRAFSELKEESNVRCA